MNLDGFNLQFYGIITQVQNVGFISRQIVDKTYRTIFDHWPH